MRKFFCFGLAWKLILAMSMTAHGRVLSTPPQSLPTVSAAPILECGWDEDRVLYSNWGDSTINAICVNPKEGKTRSAILFSGAPGIQKILPLSGGDFYAISYAKAYKFVQNPWYGQRQVQSWRIFGGGFAFNADPIYSNELGKWSETSLSFRFPWEKEGTKFWLNGDGSLFSSPLETDPRLGCILSAEFKFYEYCLDPRTWTVFRPEKTPVGTRWGFGTEFFSGRQPVNMVVGGDKLFVSLGTKYHGQSVELGRIVALGYGGRVGDTIIEETVIYNLDVVTNLSQDRLVAGQNGLYFISRSSDRRDSLWFYSFKTGELTHILSGREGEMLSGLAVALYRSKG